MRSTRPTATRPMRDVRADRPRGLRQQGQRLRRHGRRGRAARRSARRARQRPPSTPVGRVRRWRQAVHERRDHVHASRRCPSCAISRTTTATACTDEGDPGGGALCGTNVGECVAGVNRCISGAISARARSAPSAVSPRSATTATTTATACSTRWCSTVSARARPVRTSGVCDLGMLMCVGGVATLRRRGRSDVRALRRTSIRTAMATTPTATTCMTDVAELRRVRQRLQPAQRVRRAAPAGRARCRPCTIVACAPASSTTTAWPATAASSTAVTRSSAPRSATASTTTATARPTRRIRAWSRRPACATPTARARR